MARMHIPSIVAIGNLAHVDFLPAASWLAEQRATYFDRWEQAAVHLETNPSPDWLLLFSDRRGAFHQKGIERLHRRAPLAKLVHVCGSWCEGETRSGKALAGVARAYWHQFIPRANATATRHADYAGWLLPRTSTMLDVLLQGSAKPRLVEGVTILVLSSHRDEQRALSDLISSCGFRPVYDKDESASQSSAIVWSTRSLDAPAEQRLAKLASAACGQPLIVLLDFPRQAEVARALALGASAVLSKPLLLGDLRGVFAQCGLIGRRPATRQAG